MRDVFICDAVRTPIGRFGGALAKVRADDLAAWIGTISYEVVCGVGERVPRRYVGGA